MNARLAIAVVTLGFAGFGVYCAVASSIEKAKK